MPKGQAAGATIPATETVSNYPPEKRGWYVVFVLCCCNIVAFIDRQIINLLVDEIKADLFLTDTQISLLQGLAFALFYATIAVPLGRLADGGNRRNLIAIGVIVWTVAAFACGLATDFWSLFVARMFVGVGEAVLTPAGYSILADLFRERRLGLPVSVMTGSTFFGSGVALLAGGFVIASLTTMDAITLPFVGALELWQAAFMLGATPGIVVAIWFFFSVREPTRRAGLGQRHAPGDAEAGFRHAVAYWRSNGQLLTMVYVGLSLLAAAQFATGAWAPAYFIRVHGMQAADIGYVYGLLFMVFGTSGVVFGGWLADRLHASGYRDGNLRAALIGGLGALPMAVAFPIVPLPSLSLAFIGLFMFFGTMPFGAGTAVIPILAPPRVRAQLVAVYLLFANFIGQAGGPWFVASVTDRVFGRPEAVGYSLSIVVSTLLVAGAFTCWLSLGPLRRYFADRASA